MAKLNRRTAIKVAGAGLLAVGTGAAVAVANYGGNAALARYRLVPLQNGEAGKVLDNGNEVFGPWLNFGLDRNGATIQKRAGLAFIQQFDAQIAVDPLTGRDVKVWGEVLLTETSQTLPGGSSVGFWTVGFTPNTMRVGE